MAEMMLADNATVGARRRTRDGYLVAQCRVAKADNIQVYTGAEAGMPAMDSVRIYRPPEAVFDAEAMKGWAYKPVTFQHPRTGSVSAENWRDEAVGTAGGDVMRDGDYVSVPMCLMDAAAIDAVESGAAVEVSCGYRVALDHTPGTTPDGRPYDARVTKIEPNHLAIVPKGRAGSDCRVGDGAPGPAASPPGTPTPSPKDNRPMAETNDNGRAVILVDGFTVQTTPQGVEAIRKLQSQLTDAQTAAGAARAAHQQALDGLNGQLAAARQALADAEAKRDGEVTGLKLAHQQELADAAGKVAALEARTTPEALQAMAAQRAALVGVGRAVFGDAFDGAGMADADIRKAVVMKAMGPTLADAESKGAVFYDSVYEAVALGVSARAALHQRDPLRQAIANGGGAAALADAQRQQQGPTPLQKNIERLQNAYKPRPATSQGAH